MVALVLLCAATGCGNRGPRLVWPDEGGTTSFYATLPNIGAGQPMSLGVTTICRTGKGSCRSRT